MQANAIKPGQTVVVIDDLLATGEYISMSSESLS
jgi:adenine/guanine phosphoribosyltransferase-like PRPP-binding protein